MPENTVCRAARVTWLSHSRQTHLGLRVYRGVLFEACRILSVGLRELQGRPDEILHSEGDFKFAWEAVPSRRLVLRCASQGGLLKNSARRAGLLSFNNLTPHLEIEPVAAGAAC